MTLPDEPVDPSTAPPGATDPADDETFEGLDRMRSLWRTLPDEEPPARGLDALLAAAQLKATQMRPPSRWQRLLAALRRPPALAFATIIVLVAGTLVVKQRSDDPAADLPLDTASAPALRASPPRKEPPAFVPAEPPSPAAPGAAQSSLAEPSPPPRAPSRSAEPPRSKAAPSPPSPVRRYDMSKKGVSELLDEAPAGAAEAAPKAPRAAGGDRAGGKQPSVDASRIAQLFKRSETAARRGECDTARELIEQISRTDPKFEQQIPSSSPVNRCLDTLDTFKSRK